MLKINLTEKEIKRYSHQMVLGEIGVHGQKRLKEAKVLVAGAGGLGSPCALYLSSAGIGKIGIVDSDTVDLSNLQRQILHGTKDIGRAKTDSARETLLALNPHGEVETFQTSITKDNVMDLIEPYDVVVDGVDNFPTRYLLNDACYFASKPLVEAGILRFLGQLTTIKPRQGPCYRCLFAFPPPPGSVPSCQEAGILGAVAGVLGILQACEVIKLLLGLGQPLVGRILIFEALSMTFRVVAYRRNSTCPLCGHEPIILTLMEHEAICQLQVGSHHDG